MALKSSSESMGCPLKGSRDVILVGKNIRIELMMYGSEPMTGTVGSSTLTTR